MLKQEMALKLTEDKNAVSHQVVAVIEHDDSLWTITEAVSRAINLCEATDENPCYIMVIGKQGKAPDSLLSCVKKILGSFERKERIYAIGFPVAIEEIAVEGHFNSLWKIAINCSYQEI